MNKKDKEYMILMEKERKTNGLLMSSLWGILTIAFLLYLIFSNPIFYGYVAFSISLLLFLINFSKFLNAKKELGKII